uniref:Hypothetical chloroplast RF1 n=1 Tax=Sykidion marinum TaxID=44573 RepID=A0A1W6EGL2_SYKMA|nr:hypothetical chloroplast RF1 [Pseudoneochloris marina]ARK14530.1 hypothetical chloroplast RF1 [Pseudoneochloris marina]
MFFANALKDYVDQLNDLYFMLNDNLTFFVIFKSFFIYLLTSIKFAFLYIFSFQWFNDFVELPCTFKHNYIAILEGKNVFESILETKIDSSFFQFLESKPLNSNNFFTGFLNSFFLVLPFSVPQLLTIRAFLINGLPAGIYAALGTILGQIGFFTCILFGFEFLVLPFLSFEPLNYILGLIIIVNLVYNMTHKPNMEVINQSQKTTLLKLFGLNFILAWTEQTSVFQFFGNLTLTSSPNLLQSSESSQFLLTTAFYLFGILIGSLAWTALLGFFIMLLRNWFSVISTIPFMFLNERIHKLSLILTFTFCLTSIPYYGFDYLVSGPLGFLSQDKALVNLKSKGVHQIKSANGLFDYGEILVNEAPFDRSNQVKVPNLIYQYEDLSLESENYWHNKTFMRPATTLKTKQGSINPNSDQVDASRDEKNLFFKQFYMTEAIDREKKLLSENEKNLDKVATKVFRPDAYYYYSNEKNTKMKPFTQKLFREKYYSNPVYKVLTDLDMRSFLSGQPKAFNLNASDEAELYKRRVVLENYLESIQDYKTFLKRQNQNYAERVYNQQFKGTLDIVRQYYALNLSPESAINKKVLKFDQPLYNESISNGNPLLHEELALSRVDEISKKMKLNEATPFYVGWDSSLRKFLVKTAYISDVPSGIEMTTGGIKDKTSVAQFPQYLSFQAWPVTQEKQTDRQNFTLPYTPLSREASLALHEQVFAIGETNKNKLKSRNERLLLEQQPLPSYNWQSLINSPYFESVKNFIDLGTSTPPQFDGFAWPGVSDKKLIEKLL